MTKLLLSVRDADEARLALAAGADVVDVKEPAHGSLGRSDAATLASVAAVLQDSPQTLYTAAWGELLDQTPTSAGVESPAASIPARLQYVKLGLSKCRSRPDWRERWGEALAALPSRVRPVAVAYADDAAADSPDVAEILATGAALGCSILLVDTFGKDGRSLLDHWSLDRIAKLIDDVRRRGMQLALAGSLRLDHAPALLALRPDYLGVRGGACRGGRTGALDPELAARWADLVRRPVAV